MFLIICYIQAFLRLVGTGISKLITSTLTTDKAFEPMPFQYTLNWMLNTELWEMFPKDTMEKYWHKNKSLHISRTFVVHYQYTHTIFLPINAPGHAANHCITPELPFLNIYNLITNERIGYTWTKIVACLSTQRISYSSLSRMSIFNIRDDYP